MPKLIHHRNELKHFESVVSVFHQIFYGVHLDLDYSENLTIPLKEMAQSIDWTQDTVPIHSGICKSKDGKTYHLYVSDSKKHDQALTKIVIKEMLGEEDINDADAMQ